MKRQASSDNDSLKNTRKGHPRGQPCVGFVGNESNRNTRVSSGAEPGRRYQTVARAMGLLPGLDLDNVHELIAQVEGELHR